MGGAVLAAALGLSVAGGGAAAGGSSASTFTGYAFDTCNAPPSSTLQSWLGSSYRALGIYIGGANRACANTELSANWVASVVSSGWSLIPLYVGLQAPCVSRGDLAKISDASASTQGVAAADDAVTDASALGMPGGSPIYFDMEGYALDNPGCTQTVQTFVSSWVTELHTRGYLAGVYGSAASTMRDLQPLAATGASPDDVWIADWNGVEAVFGDPYVSDTLWSNHQRLHQYRGGHDETWGGVMMDIDSSYVDGAVVSSTGSAPPPPIPVVPSSLSAAGSVSSSDSESTVNWPAGTFEQSVVVGLTPSTPTEPVPGFGRGGYGVQLQVQQTATSASLRAGFRAPVTIHIAARPGHLAPMTSTNGITWRPLVGLIGSVLPAGHTAGYARNEDGSVDIETMKPGYFALLTDTARPPAPSDVTGRFEHGSLVLHWQKSIDPSGPAASYQVTLTNRPLLAVTGQTAASLHAFHHNAPSVYRVLATNAAGNVSEPSKPIVVLPSKRPAKLPKALPAWAWQLFAWQQSGKAGPRPKAPKIVPSWYWRWEAWRAYPFVIRP